MFSKLLNSIFVHYKGAEVKPNSTVIQSLSGQNAMFFLVLIYRGHDMGVGGKSVVEFIRIMPGV